jgi:AraC-like DNA-binding protein/ligand-binding sensor protein
MNKNEPAGVVQQLSRSRIYWDYELAFGAITKLPLKLSSIGGEREVQRIPSKYANRFCAILARKSKICAACLEVQHGLTSTNISSTQTVRCFAGLTVTSVPVKLEERVIAFLRTGQVFLRTPKAERFQKITSQLMKWGMKINFARLKEAYFHSRVVSPSLYSAIVRFLEIFAEHLALVAHQLTLHERQGDSLMIRRAKDYVASHQSDPIKLEEIARAVNVSTFHFCRRFKQTTGLTFVQYLNRTRIEKAKILLHDNSLRISEIAYDIGFQTLAHFNRIFRKLVGCSPTEYRSRLAEIG